MDSAHIGIDLSDRSSNYDVADAARLQTVGESQHGNEDSERNYTIVLKPVELDDAGNQIPFNATDTSTISYRTEREDILSSSIGYNNQIWLICVYKLGYSAWTGGYIICGLDYLIWHTNEQINEQGCFSYHMGKWLCRGFDAGYIYSMYYHTIQNWCFFANLREGEVIVSSS